jgi:hypothetical protein
MSSFKFSSSLSCLSCFNFFSKCFKSNNSQSEDQVFLLGNNNKLSQHGSDTKFLVELTPAPPKNSPEQSPKNDSSRNASPTPSYTSVQAYTGKELLKDGSTIDAIFPELSSASSDFALSPASTMSSISQEFSHVAVEISQSPELRFSRSYSPEIDPRVIFTKSPSQIFREKNSNELSQNQTQSMFDKIVGCSNDKAILPDEAFQRRTIATLCSLLMKTPSKSQDPRRLSTYRRISSQIQSGLLDPLERKPIGNSLRPGTESPLKNSATMVPTSKALEVAMRINRGMGGGAVCNF